RPWLWNKTTHPQPRKKPIKPPPSTAPAKIGSSLAVGGILKNINPHKYVKTAKTKTNLKTLPQKKRQI
ncbi:hypothetical protein ACQWG0_25140, partial [Salmonella enterica subsp. enterica serovar Infantis]